jgi:hypothetical protein
MQKQISYPKRLTFILLVFLFILALLPRLLALDSFLTPDEYRWLGRSRDFLTAVLSKDWAATLQTGHDHHVDGEPGHPVPLLDTPALSAG